MPPKKRFRLARAEARLEDLINNLNLPLQVSVYEEAYMKALQRFQFEVIEETSNLVEFLPQFAQVLKGIIDFSLREGVHGMKFQMVVTGLYRRATLDVESPLFDLHLRSTNKLYLVGEDIDSLINSLNQELLARNEHVLKRGSGAMLIKLFYITIFLSRFEPLAAGAFVSLPSFLAKKRAIINVKNKDQRCFGYAILSALYPAKERYAASRYTSYSNRFQEEGIHLLDYPIDPSKVPEIEANFNYKINIFAFYDDVGQARYPLYISKRPDMNREITLPSGEIQIINEIDLLYWDGHYAWIKDFSKFIYDLYGAHAKKFFCKRCFGVFITEIRYQEHQTLCNRPDFDSVIYRFPQEGTILKFTNVRYMVRCPFVIFADFECLLVPTNQNTVPTRKRPTVFTAQHVPSSAAFYVASDYPSCFKEQRFFTYTGKDVAEWFLKMLLEIAEICWQFLKQEERLQMKHENWIDFRSAKVCYICQQPFLEDGSNKVRDHDHFTGEYRGAAHASCNLNFRSSYKIPVFFHNFRGYDSHIVSIATSKFPEIPLRVIGQGYEKYLTLSFGKHLVFKDSYQFMSCALGTLANNLKRSGGLEEFSSLQGEFPDFSADKIELLLRKGVFPYEYMTDWEKLRDTSLPPIEAFYSTKNQEPCKPEDYNHATKVWETFSCKMMQDYQDLYLKTDVLLLADVFQTFRRIALKNYRLDPAHYVSSPQLTWDAMLLFTNCQLELIADPEIFFTIDGGIRGGVSMVAHRYGKANNPEMGEQYDPERELSYIAYLDANNLYGWAMSQYMPISGFHWLKEDEWNQISWTTLSDNAPIGYILECDLIYPPNLHDQHNDFPLSPERVIIKYEMVNKFQLRILRHYSSSRNNLRVSKLIPNFLPKKNYVVHYRNLKFYLKEGLKLEKIHRVLKFNQRPWLQPYIQKNTDIRAKAQNDQKKDQAKLFNNAIYGKTCENQKKRTDIHLVNNEKKCRKLLNKPHLRGFRIFTPQLAAIDLRKIHAKIDKPFYVGFTVLELSKLHMYKFHYEYIKPIFGDAVRLLYTDTDSLMYVFIGRNPFEIFFRDRDEYFDFASYPKDHKYYDPKNNKVLGKFKDEANGFQIIEFVGLRPKMYSFLLQEQPGKPPKEKHRAKGIQYQVTSKLRHQQYLDQLNLPRENFLINRRIGAKLHQIYSIETQKRGLSAFDDKRVLLEDGISTVAYGHYRVTAEENDTRSDERFRPLVRERSNSDPLHLTLGEDPRMQLMKIRKMQTEPISLEQHSCLNEVNPFGSEFDFDVD